MAKQRDAKMIQLVKDLKKKLNGLTFEPDFISRTDSDPRYNALRVINAKLKIDIEWNWEKTDFSKIHGEPIIIEFSTKDNITLIEAVLIINDLCKDQFKIINGSDLIIILTKD